jgi:ABC-2 type transport system ATP-binding protein
VDSTVAVVTHDLAVRRGRTRILHGIDVALVPGELVGLLGPSGSGKTTLIRSIVGAQRITRGSATVLGQPAGSRPLRGRIGYMAQSSAIYDDLTVQQNVRYFARVRGSSRADADAAISAVDLDAFRGALVSRLSGGQRNRVSLAIALVGRPPILVLDEPTVGLDPLLRRDLWALFRSLADDGTTVVVSSHVMDEARRCDRLLLLHDGRLIADTTPDGLLAETATSDHDAAFLALVERNTP